MRELKLQQTAAEALAAAQAAAIAAIGVRRGAISIMRNAERAELLRLREKRWKTIVELAARSCFEPLREDECAAMESCERS